MNHDQFTLPFLDTTIVAEGFGLYGGFPTAKSPAPVQMNLEPEEAEVLDASIPIQPSLPAKDYRLACDRKLAAGWKARAEDNLAAIRLMTTIEAEARHARPDEQERLARFTAFGASDLADRIFRRAGDAFAPTWEDLGVELAGLVSRDDLANLKRATQYAHYTPEFMIRAIWRALRRMGFDGGRVLEPGCGTGLFFALCPEALVGKLALTGVEMDPTTARIAKLLYPNALIRHEDFTKARLPELYDLAIGNPPFSDRTVRADDPAGDLRLSLHDYFIARSVERLRKGGLAAFVTSRWTMDKVDGKARQHIAAMADLIGAVRLPEGAMHDRAATEVVVDILFLQKRDAGTAPAGAAWDVLAEAVPAGDGETALSINRYFVEHPEMALGTHARTSSAYGPVYTLKPVLSTPGALSDLLAQALDRLPRDLFKPTVKETKPSFPSTVHVGTAAEGATIKEGSYLIHEGALVQIIGGEPQAVAVRDGKGTEGIPAKHARIIRSLIVVRDAVREVLRAQANDEPWGSAQIRLRSAYALFVRNFGPINLTTISETVTAEGETRETFRRPNLQPFLDDPDVWLVASIEDYDLESGTAKHGPIFRERVLHPETTPVIETAEDALAVTLHETGLVDLDRVAELLGRSRETAIAELGERIFLDPEPTAVMNRDVWVTADAYLSGKIRDKLTAAQGAAALDPRYRRNVTALERTLPEDLKPSDITARLGAPWIPADVVASFAEETGVNAQRRLKALHHLDVPRLPSQIEQREGRIERQGNENDEIELYAYATKRSVDATGWQILERKARFIDAAMSGDRSVRRIEDAGSQANQFALAKAIASADERRMRKAGIASEIARLERLRDSHFDDQFALRRKITFGEKRLQDATRRIEAIAQDLARRIPTRGDAFTMTVGDRRLTERKAAGEALIAFVRKMKPQKPGATAPIAAIGGFTIVARTSYFDDIELRLDRALKSSDAIAYEKDVTPLGLVSRLESALGRFEVELTEERRTVTEVSGWLPGFKARLGDAFPHETELEEKRAEMAELDASLAATTKDAPTPASNAAA